MRSARKPATIRQRVARQVARWTKGTVTERSRGSTRRPRNGDTRPLSLSALDALQNTSGTVEDPDFPGTRW